MLSVEAPDNKLMIRRLKYKTLGWNTESCFTGVDAGLTGKHKSKTETPVL